MDHQDATTPFTGQEDLVVVKGMGRASVTLDEVNVPSSGQRRVTATAIKGVIVPGPASFPDPSGDALQRAQAQAQARVLKQIVAANTSFQGGVFFGELREAIHQIRHPAQAMRDFILGVNGNYRKRLQRARRSRDPKKLQIVRTRVQKAIADTHLELAFGVRPLISDASDAGAALARMLFERPAEYVPFRGKGKAEAQVGTVVRSVLTADPLVITVEQRQFNRAKAMIYGELVYRPATFLPSKVHNWLQVFGLSMEQFVPTAWELLPFSFLFDYWTNIGEIIQGCSVDLSHIQRKSQVWKAEGVLQHIYTSVVPKSVSAPHSQTGSGYFPTIENVRRRVTRITYADLSPPRLSLHMPGHTARWANMAALVVSGWKESTRFKVRGS